MQLKQNVGTKVPVRLRAVVDGSALANVTYQQVVVFIQKQSGASASKVLGPTDWVEVDAVNMPGEYDLVLTNGELDTLGFFKYFVNYPGISMIYPGLMQVVSVIESDTYARIGAPVGASISADLQNAITNIVASIKGANNKDLSQVDTDVQTAITNLGTLTAIAQRILALSYDNVAEDGMTYDANGKLTASTLWFYDTAAHAVTNDHALGLLYKYLIVGTYDVLGNCLLFRMTRAP